MARIWSDEGKLATWLEVEQAATAAWAELGVVPEEAAERSGARGDARGQALWRRRDLCRDGSGARADRVRADRARARAHLDADPPARPPRRAPRGACGRRVLARLLRPRGPAPGAHRGRRGAGAVRPRPEGLVGD